MFFLISILSMHAQVFKKGDIKLSLFTINDSSKYFEITTPSLAKDSVMCGVLHEKNSHVFYLKDASVTTTCRFEIIHTNENGVDVKFNYDTTLPCYKLYMDISGKYLRSNEVLKEEAFRFPVNRKAFFRCIKGVRLKAYKYPSNEANFKVIEFKPGEVIEIRRFLGKVIDNKENARVGDVFSANFIFHQNEHGWFVVSEIYKNFKGVR